MTSPPLSEENRTDLIVEFLDKVYAITSEEENPFVAFDQLVHSAATLYFEDAHSEKLIRDLQMIPDQNPAWIRHLERAARRIEERTTGQAEPLCARLLLSGDSDVVMGNAAAQALFGVTLPCLLDEVPLSSASRAFLKELRDKRLNDPDWFGQTSVLTLDTVQPVQIVRCMPTYLDGDGQSGARALSLTFSTVDWTSTLDRLAQQHFDLSPAETELLALLVEGHTQPQAARLAGKSVETIKAQAKSILRKTGQVRMSDVTQLATSYAFMAVTEGAANDVPDEKAAQVRTLALGTGRDLAYRVFGHPGGRPYLWVHGLIQGPFLSPQMAATLVARRIRIIAPSRPGFDQTSPASHRSAFDAEVVSDTLALLDHLGVDGCPVIAHQGGVSHACRIAAALPTAPPAIFMVGAGIPIDETTHLASMNPQTRMGAIATRRNPAMLEVLLKLGIAIWRKNPRGYLHHYFGRGSLDVSYLDNPEFAPLMLDGVGHMISAGPKAIVDDAKSALSDWTAAYLALPCPAYWAHSHVDPIMGFAHVTQFLETHPGTMLADYPDGGNNLFYVHFEGILDRITGVVDGRDS